MSRHMYMCPHTHICGRAHVLVPIQLPNLLHMCTCARLWVYRNCMSHTQSRTCVPTICASRACTGAFAFSVLCRHQDVLWEFSCTCLCANKHRWVPSHICRLARVSVCIHVRKRVCIYVLAVVLADMHDHACT